jgi:Chaperone of endosialidase
MASIITADTGAVSGTAGLKQSADSSGILALATGTGTTAVTIDASQNVGVGTSSPQQRLDVTGGYLQLRDSTGSGGYRLTIGADSTSCRLNSVDNTPLTFSMGGSEKARIDSSGNLLVGTTDSSSSSGVGVKVTNLSSAPTLTTVCTQTTSALTTYQLYSTGAAAFRFYVGAQGQVYATNTTISAISDQRFKENIRDLEGGLEKVLALKPRLYDWKEGKGADIKNARGFIAQEFEQVFPDLIDEWADPAPEGEEPYKSVRQDLMPVLVKAIQEQQALITTLTERISALEAK